MIKKIRVGSDGRDRGGEYVPYTYLTMYVTAGAEGEVGISPTKRDRQRFAEKTGKEFTALVRSMG